jgi:hypothetical protein
MTKAQKDYANYLKSPQWQAVSFAVKKRGGYKCQVCNSPHDLQAHHRTYENRGNELNHLDDLICLCRRCHNIFHGINQPPVEPNVEKVKISIPKIKANVFIDNGKTVVLTHENIMALRTDKNGFTNATIMALGMTPRMLIKGWVVDMCGKEIPEFKYLEALEGRTTFCSLRKTLLAKQKAKSN